MVETLRQKSKLLATFISWFALSCKCWWLVFRRRSRARFCENKSTEILFWLPIAGTHTTWPASQFWSSDVSHMLILTSNKQGVYRGGLVLKTQKYPWFLSSIFPTSFNIVIPHQIKPKITKQGMNNPAQNTALEKIQCIFTTKDFSLLIGIEF